MGRCCYLRFWANKHFVFKSANETGKEAYQFFILRLGTLLVESGLLFILFSYYLQMRCYQK
ncbi:MAG: GtrA family protein [Thomasclavelia ramosa]